MPDHTDSSTLRRLYNEEGLSMRAIASKCNVSASTIRHHMEKFHIERRGPNEHPNGGRQLPGSAEPLKDPKWLSRKYHDEGLIQAEIADLLGTSQSTVMRYMQKHDIKARRRGRPILSGDMTEPEVVSRMIERLESLGHNVTTEVQIDNWFCDIYLPDADVAFEAKGWSEEKPDILKAVGQAMAYRIHGASASFVVAPSDSIYENHVDIFKGLSIGLVSLSEREPPEVVVPDESYELKF